MDNLFKRTKFFEALSYLFNHFFEFLKLFLLTLLNTFVIGLISLVPFVGWIAAFVFGILTIMFVPFGVVNIVCDIKVGFDIYSDFYEYLPRAFTKPIVVQGIKIALIGVTTIVIWIVLIAGSLTTGSIETLLASFIMIIPFIFIVVIAETKMIVTLMLLIASTIYEDYDVAFFTKEKKQYRYLFLWMYVPIINILASYVFATIFAIDIKRYYDL